MYCIKSRDAKRSNIRSNGTMSYDAKSNGIKRMIQRIIV